MPDSSPIAVYSTSDLKNTTDDALPNYLNSISFRQTHTYTDVRLLLGYSAVAIAVVTFYADYKHGWDATKALTLWAVVAYFAINSLLTYWIWAVEKGRVYVGHWRGNKIQIQSTTEKYSPIYHLRVKYFKPSRSPHWYTLHIEASFTEWFDEKGNFVARPFQTWLAREVPLIGDADPTKKSPALAEKTATLKALVEAEGVGTGADTPGGKSRKKKKGGS